MSFPSISSYKDALRIAEHSLRQLNHLRPVEGQNGDLYFSSGNFAVVFKMRDTRDGSLKALKCFTRDQERRRDSLEWVSTYLDWVISPYIIPYKYFNDELWAEDSDHPVLLMDWVEGETLGNYVQKLCARQDRNKLQGLCERFVKMALWLLDQPWAHGDLKHDNIIVRPDGSLVLVDYDGCFIPGMEGQPARELGSPAFQHPRRSARNFDRHIDDFSILVIFLSLQLLIVEPDLFSKNATGENLVLGNADIQNSGASKLLNQFRQNNDVLPNSAIALLDLAVAMPPGKAIGLAEVLNEFEKFVKIKVPHLAKSASHKGMVLIPGGTFLMGDVMGDNESINETVHEVTLSTYLIGAYAVTFDEYDAFCTATKREKPSERGWGWGRIWGRGWGRGKRPVINVSWEDAIAYCNWRSKQEGFEEVYEINGSWISASWRANGYRLPTEAEWEYAARARGKKVRFGNGKDIADPKEINFNGRSSSKKTYFVAGEYCKKTLPVGSFTSNALGLYDMSGNVWEWCWDWYSSYPTSAQTNPKGSIIGSSLRVIRGGSWYCDPQYCRVANRYFYSPGDRDDGIGFRLSRTL